MLTKALHTVCMDILREYLDDPWRWLRENDLVVDVVTRVRDSLSMKAVPARLSGPGFDRRLVDASTTPRKIQRVRTEVKVAHTKRQARAIDDEESDSPKERRDRIDVCVLAEDHTVDVVVHEKGVRDVVLKVLERDVAGLLEAKLYSDLYIKGGYCGWLDDLVKLSRIATKAVRGVLYLDTALPLESVAVDYRQKRGESNTLLRAAGKLPPWPLIEGDSFDVQYKDRDHQTRTVSFCHVVDADEVGVYLWGLAVRRTARWKPSFVSKRSTPLAVAEVIPSCWKVSFAKSK